MNRMRLPNGISRFFARRWAWISIVGLQIPPPVPLPLRGNLTVPAKLICCPLAMFQAWIIIQISGVVQGLEQLFFHGKTLRGSLLEIEGDHRYGLRPTA